MFRAGTHCRQTGMSPFKNPWNGLLFLVLVYCSFFYLENWRRYEPKCKKMDRDKMNRLSIIMCEDGISFKPKKTFLKLDSQRPIIYQIKGNFMTILMDLSDLRFYLCKIGKIQFYRDHFLCKSHYTMVNNKKVDSYWLDYLTQSKQLSPICKVQPNSHLISIDLVYSRSQ